MNTTIHALQTALALLRQEEARRVAELEPLLDVRRILTGTENLRKRVLTEDLRHIRNGFDPAEAISIELGDLMARPEIAGLRVARPCIATVERLIAQARQDAERPVEQPRAWPRRYRYRALVRLDEKTEPKPPGPHVHEGRLLVPGDEVLLTEGQASAWADKFEEVTG